MDVQVKSHHVGMCDVQRKWEGYGENAYLLVLEMIPSLYNVRDT